MKQQEPSSVERLLAIAARLGIRVVVEDPVPGAGVEAETNDPEVAYAAVRERYGLREQSRYRAGWLFDG